MPMGVYLTERKRRNLSLAAVLGVGLLFLGSWIGFVFLGAAVIAWMFRRSSSYVKRWRVRVF